MTSNHHALMTWAHVLQWTEQRAAKPRGCQSHKSVLSSDRSLQLDCVKLESLVIADQHAAVNTFLALYTPPVTREFVTPEVGEVTFRSQPPKVGQMIGVKS